MPTLTSSLINFTLEAWQHCSSEKLIAEDARQIISNVTAFFSILSDWDMHSQLGSGSIICGSVQSGKR